jgi:PadR family transcriptional regulator PadR
MPGDPKHEPAELVLLSLLAERPLYGYAITKEAAARSEGRLRLTPGVLYPLLKTLEAQGLILSTWETIRSDRAGEEAEDGDGRRRKWYRLSAKGRKRLEQRVAAHRAYRAVIDAFIGPGAGAEEAP